LGVGLGAFHGVCRQAEVTHHRQAVARRDRAVVGLPGLPASPAWAARV